ncbi:MAG TPA: hypothetical protein VI451_08265, partial [Anaerolineales bacterium]|nr:hypothetical protein [Anaerolineales bacterium]
MATIPLRDYCREIENMVERGHTDEAIAHCRHILKHFPKHIETYRQLGKAFLESRQLGDAADIFQRVLSSIPDDFVSHIGMSIIREDEGNLDAAIWHMERAFEVQSSNIAIQDELRRLYGNRDGQEPPKIRLTRGALAHMYAHGHLYSQAIAELRAALTTDPNRLDLQALLAKMYRADKQLANAAKTASQLVAKLPYCLPANQVLVDILTHSQRTDEAGTYRVRIQELDPYYKHISAQYPTLDAVPSGVTVIEALDWEATKGGLISQPAWATSIGVDISNTPAGDELPEWLTPSPSGKQGDSSFGEISFDDNLAAFASPIPDSGYDLKTSQTTDRSFENIQPEDMTMQEEENDNIPDWMKDAGWAPRDPDTPEGPPPPLFDDEEVETGEGEIAKASIPDWLQAMAPGDVPEQDGERTRDDFPEWLQDSSSSETAPSRVSDSNSNLPPLMGDSDESASPTPSEDLPEWLKEMGGPPPSPVSEGDVDVPDWLADRGDMVPTSDISMDDMEESIVPDWLQEMSDEVVSSTIMGQKEQQDTTDGLSEERVESDSGEPALDELFGESQQEEVASSDVDWLGEIGEEQDSSGVTDWLSSMEQGDVEEEAALPAPDVPDWLQDLGQEIPETGELFQIEEPEPQSEADEVPASFAMEDLGKDAEADFGLEDDAMAWLESLAAKQGAKEEELLIKPEDRQETS